MPIFGNIGLSLPGSGSEITSSFNVLPVYFASPSYSRSAATIGTLEAFVTEYDDTGSYGELSFRIPSKENRNTTGSKVLTIFATGSNNEPRVGIGFGENEKPIKAFEVKTKSDTAEGSEFLIHSSRLSQGAEIGDSAGSIRFSIDSASYKDITTSGSVALIDTEITTVESEGVTGDLIFKTATSARLAPTEIMRIRGGNSKVSVTGSIDVDGNITTNLIGSLNETALNNTHEIESIPTSSVNGLIYDYYIIGQTSNSNDARTGQFFVASDINGNITFTDTSTPSTRGSSSVELSASLDGGNIQTWLLNGQNYKFRAFTKKLKTI